MRITIIFALLVSLTILLRSGITAWQFTPASPPQKSETVPESAFHDKDTVNFFHDVPQPLPDLHKGYIFNADRMLVQEEPTEIETEAGKDGGDEIDIDFDSVSYVGSIITGNLRKAIITYSVTPNRRSPFRRTARRLRTSRSARPSASQNKYAQLVIGDNFNGYKVSDITADKIVFQREDERIEKFLHDPAKQRLILPSSIAGVVRGGPAAAGRQIPVVHPDKEQIQARAQPTAPARSAAKTRERPSAAAPQPRSRSNPRRRLRSVPSTTTPGIDR